MDVVGVRWLFVFLQEIFVIEDCWRHYTLTDNTHESAFTIPSGTTVSYSSDGMRLSANAYKQIKLTDKLTSDCSVEFTVSDYTSTTDNSIIIFAYTNGETTPNQSILTAGTSNSNNRRVFNSVLDHDLIKGAKYRIEYTSSTLKVYENNVLLGSASNNVGFPTRFEWHMGANSRYAVYKDLKVKAL